jgi:CHASE2 domain-containing sensor protein
LGWIDTKARTINQHKYSMLKKILTSPWTALITLALIISIRIADPSFVESVRLRYFDTLITAKAPTDNNIVTVNIDEAALDKLGQWPLPRAKYADIVQDLYQTWCRTSRTKRV